MDETGPPCRRCKERNLGCVLKKSLQSILSEKTQYGVHPLLDGDAADELPVVGTPTPLSTTWNNSTRLWKAWSAKSVYPNCSHSKAVSFDCRRDRRQQTVLVLQISDYMRPFSMTAPLTRHATTRLRCHPQTRRFRTRRSSPSTH